MQDEFSSCRSRFMVASSTSTSVDDCVAEYRISDSQVVLFKTVPCCIEYPLCCQVLECFFNIEAVTNLGIHKGDRICKLNLTFALTLPVIPTQTRPLQRLCRLDFQAFRSQPQILVRRPCITFFTL